MVVAVLVQHRYNTDTALDTNWMIYRNDYMSWILMVMEGGGGAGGEFGVQVPGTSTVNQFLPPLP